MSFHEVQFPTDLSIGATGGPERRTEIVTLSNGFEERNSPWEHSRRRFDAGLGVRSIDDLEKAIGFFEARRGQLYGFRWKDWTDYRSGPSTRRPTATDQRLGLGDGTRTVFQLVKTYASGGSSYVRPITKPVNATVRTSVGGSEQAPVEDFSVNYATGEVIFAEAPGDGVLITAGFEFDVPVRFDTDRITASLSGFEAGEIPSIPVVEVRSR